MTLNIYRQNATTIYVKYKRKIICKFFFDFDTQNTFDIVKDRVIKDGKQMLQLYCKNKRYLTCYNNGVML